MDSSLIRNLSTIAHIDHGKSTLADRLLEVTGALSQREMLDQVLDDMDLERERGITIKAHAVRLNYKADDGNTYILNLIDTPGHVDFTYEVSRSLASCEGALVIIDASQGVEAQTLANVYLAMDNKPLKALIFDSWFDSYNGAVVLTRVIDGEVKIGDKILLMSNNKDYEISQIGILTQKPVDLQSLSAGEVGFITAGIKKISDTKIGDTITSAINPTKEPFPGYKEVKSMVFSGLYTIISDDYQNLRDALEKLRLNDSAFTYEPETSLALGFGFRCGFLGLLHMEIIRERLEREFNLSLISTAPTVVYQITTNKNEILTIDNPVKMPEAHYIERFEEPFILANIILPDEYVGSVMQLCQDRRGIQKEFTYLGKDRVLLKYELPLNEIVLDFYDKLKSLTKGYASLDYEFIGYRESDLVRLDVLLNGEIVDALSFITHREKAAMRGRQLEK